MMSLRKKELLLVSVLITLESVEADVSDILWLGATSGVTSRYINQKSRKKTVLCENHCIIFASVMLLHVIT